MRILVATAVLFVCGCTSDSGEVTKNKKKDKDPVDSDEPVEVFDTGPFYSAPADCGEGVAPGSVELMRRWPYLQSVTTTSAIIAWATDTTGAEGAVHWGRDATYGSEGSATHVEIGGAELETLHLFHVQLDRLEPGTEYCYRVMEGDTELAGALRFRTAPASDNAPVKFIAFGDYGTGNQPQFDIRDQIEEHLDGAGLWLTTGDNAYNSGTYHEFQTRIFDVYQDQWHRLPVFTTSGNHDYITDEAQPYLDNFFLPENAWRENDKERYYSMDWGPIHFVGLDSETPLFELTVELDDDMIDWLDADLAATDKPWTIVAWHRPPYEGHPARAPDLFSWYHIVPLLEKHDVDLVLLGHNHYYERMKPIRNDLASTVDEGGVTYVITGSGGRALYDVAPWDLQEVAHQDHNFLVGEVDGCTLSIRAINGLGVELDQFSLDRCESPQ